jgi:hypothetical protein
MQRPATVPRDMVEDLAGQLGPDSLVACARMDDQVGAPAVPRCTEGNMATNAACGISFAPAFNSASADSSIGLRPSCAIAAATSPSKPGGLPDSAECHSSIFKGMAWKIVPLEQDSD